MRVRDVLGGAALGAAAAYLWDPDRGRRRRVQLRDRLMAGLRDASDRLGRRSRKLVADAEGRLNALAARRRGAEPVDDVTLADRVRSTVLGSDDIPSGEIHVDAFDGIVTLRGELPDRSLIDRIVADTRRVAGVRAVDDLLHMPGETPANKAAALRASRGAAGSAPTREPTE